MKNGQMLKFREERRLDRRLVREVERRGGRALKAEVVGWKGWPDRMVLVPPASVWFVELKSPDGVLSERQKYTGEWLRSKGFSFFVVNSDEQLDLLLSDIDDFINNKQDKNY